MAPITAPKRLLLLILPVLAAAALPDAAAAADATVSIAGSAAAFNPATVTIKAGEKVTLNFAQSTSPHSIVRAVAVVAADAAQLPSAVSTRRVRVR